MACHSTPVPVQNTSSATSINISYVEMDKLFACLENSGGCVDVTASGIIIHSRLLMRTVVCPYSSPQQFLKDPDMFLQHEVNVNFDAFTGLRVSTMSVRRGESTNHRQR